MENIFKRKPTKLDMEIDSVVYRLAALTKDSKEYTEVLANLERLYKIKSLNADNRISSDTKAIIAGNLLGIMLILSYEKVNVITTKAMQLVIKGRV